MRRASTLGVSVCGAAAVAFTLYAGRRNPSVLLMALFVAWVLSPFAALLWMEKVRKRGSLGGFALLIAAISVAIYGYVALGHPRQRTAFSFLIVPLVSWLLIAVMAVAGRRSTGT